ncbi:hypothetical protein ACFWAN_32390 [Streptomyces mirabilis]|uniref:hypothetical protein n=1 Tax=Streptomyces mirabilis TaxID=68239 RepID=UPI003666C383
MPDKFWEEIASQLSELESAQSADDVIRILSHERNPYKDGVPTGADGFFAGSGGDGTVRESLEAAGWKMRWSRAGYFYAMQAPDCSEITYIEGDIYRGNTRA